MKSLARSLAILALAALPLSAQAKPAPKPKAAPASSSFAVSSMREGWKEFAMYVEQSAADMPAEKYSFTPVAGARTFAEIIAHVAGSSYMFCAAVLGDKPKDEDALMKTKEKAELITALKESTAYCAKAYAISDAAAHGEVNMFGGKHDKLWALMLNMSHDAEQYGNLLPYLRMNGLTPPSSKPPTPKS